jgi:glucosamine--fructose-6-phosphate aminotransferase (isomerizing)
MCGIIGYVGADAALPVVLEGLRNLEYRGYDSAGVALVEADGLAVTKRAGEVSALEAAVPESSPATCGVGHTRWSTHGKPTDANAHPHTDCVGDVAVVHNGIVENYDTLREELSATHEFDSETDTEVIPHLIEDELDAGATLREAVEAATERLSGTYAVVAVASGREELVATRQDSPLVVGHGDDETVVASDVPAFVERTREVSFLEDGDVVRVTEAGATVYREGEPVDPDRQTVEWDAEAAAKGGYDHYMLKEINEQPRALRQTLSGRVDHLAGEVDLDVELPQEYLRSLEEVQFVAAGTSYHAGAYAARLFERHADVPASARIASEYEFTAGRDPWRTLVVAVTQSGETADTLGAVRRANRAGARTLAVTNTLGSTVTREADDAVFIKAGPEIGVAATKTFASQVTTLALLAVDVGRQRGTLAPDAASDLLEDLRGLPGAVQQVLDDEPRIRAVAEEYADGDAYFFIGRNLGYPVAIEGALKLKEISYDHAEGFPAGELKHGPLALVTPRTPVLALLTRGTRPDETLNNVKEVQSRGAPVVGLTSDPAHEKLLDATLSIPDLGELEPLVANVYLQLFAYHVARLQDRAIDKPRNLAKSVTVE